MNTEDTWRLLDLKESVYQFVFQLLDSQNGYIDGKTVGVIATRTAQHFEDCLKIQIELNS